MHANCELVHLQASYVSRIIGQPHAEPSNRMSGSAKAGAALSALLFGQLRACKQVI